MVNAEPFELEIFSSLSDDNGNLVDVQSTIINCTEYVLGMTVVISSLSYDNNGNTTINYFVSGTSGTDTLDIYLVGNLTPLTSISPVSDGGGSWVYAATLTTDTVYTFYAVLRNANFISSRLALVQPGEVIIANSVISATAVQLELGVNVANTYSETAQFYVDGVAWSTPASGVSDITTTITIPGTLAVGDHTVYIKLVTSGVQSNELPFTV